MKASRIAISHQALEILQHCQATDFLNFWPKTSPGSFWSILILFWCLGRVQRWCSGNTYDKIETEKCMISIIRSISGIHSLLALARGRKYKMQFSVLLSTCYPGYPAIHLLIEPQKTLKGILLHLDNATIDNSRLSSEMIECAKAQGVPHAPYGPGEA
jgi:hypothetical protein